MESRSSTFLTVAAVTVATGVLAYAVYFDYKRRNDSTFRKKLRKEKKRVEKHVAQQSKEDVSATSAPSDEITQDVLREALDQIKNEPAPLTPDDKEAYFMQQVGTGEQLAARGAAFYLPAALAFFRALRVYPSPVELIVIYQKTVPEPVFKLIIDMTNLDVKARVEGYYDHFPPKSTNVSVETRAGSGAAVKKVLVVTKDFKAGDVIYKEHPVVTALDADLHAAGTHCFHCLRHIQSPLSIPLPSPPSALASTFCSKPCLLASKAHSTSLLFTLENPLPAEIPTEAPTEGAQATRKAAQDKFVAYLEEQGRAGPELVARFIARQVALETAKMVEASTGMGGAGKKGVDGKEREDFTDAEGGDYLLADHIERLRYLEVVPPKEELPLLVEVLKTALPGLEQFVTDERHATLLGKMKYNAFGVCFGGGRDDKPAPTQRPEDVEKTRTPYGTQRQIGSAVYTLSSYLPHSCQPSARPSFSNGTAQLHLIANRDLKAGDELSVAYVDVTQHPDESAAECRRRRRIEIARGWRFACQCVRCEEEGAEMSVAEKEEEKEGEVGRGEEGRDESKVEASLERYEEADAGAVAEAAAVATGDVE